MDDFINGLVTGLVVMVLVLLVFVHSERDSQIWAMLTTCAAVAVAVFTDPDDHHYA